MTNTPSLSELLGIEYPIIMAPMFLISNINMMEEALNSGITAAIPALNFRTDDELRYAITSLKNKTDKPFGVNIIVNKSNLKYLKNLQTCIDLNIDFIITSLGNPKEVIAQCKPHGIKVLCDVIDLKHAVKVEELGADAVIAVNSMAGGHTGNIDSTILVPLLKKKLNIPVISAGGIATATQYDDALTLGADGVSIGTLFIASTESEVSNEYKNAILNYRSADIILTSKISGTPLTIINTPYFKETNTEESWLNKLMRKNPRFKKYIRLLIMFKGIKTIKNAATKNTYKEVWCAGPSIEYINEIKSVKDIVRSIVSN